MLYHAGVESVLTIGYAEIARILKRPLPKVDFNEGFFLSSVKYRVVKVEYQVKTVKFRVELVEYQVKIVEYRVKIVEYRVKLVE